jgi:protein-L-isoaspartate O-methyltransferase
MSFLFPVLTLLFAISGDPDTQRLAPVYPTPQTIVERMLQLGGLQPGERMCDLGSGDGRIVITAARQFHANATGIEIDPILYRQSMEQIRSLGLAKTARVINGDLLKQRYSAYDLITVYLLPEANNVIQPMLERDLKRGTRIVSHDFAFEGWRPVKIETIDDDGAGRSHVLYLYQR